MGGKKKTLANRLARMSDEERARYLQHKADMEEEAKRRKEQLIATFMKNKIKKEDGFSRLNLAKINQQWHQILRLTKCKQMKEDVEHLKKHISRVVEYKNRTIGKLLEELEMAEEQYSHNFNAHITHIDQTIASHNEYMRSLQAQYQNDLEELLLDSKNEEDEFLNGAVAGQENLKTVIFAQEMSAKNKLKDDYERFLKRKDDFSSTFRLELEKLVKQREDIGTAIWRQIAAIVGAYVRQNDARRLHLAELRRLDAESAAEIASNQDRMKAQEDEIRILKGELEATRTQREEKIKALAEELHAITRQFESNRKQLRKEIARDQSQLFVLTDTSNRAIEVLTDLKRKGSHIVNLMQTCKKLETEREQFANWLPDLTADEYALRKERPKTSVSRSKTQSPADTPSTSREVARQMVDKVVISEKSPASSPSSDEGVDAVNTKFEVLMNMEQFWLLFSRVDVDFKELKKEKKTLLEQNKQFRGMIRAVLEAAALAKSIPDSKVSTRVASQSRSVCSAPLRRIVL